MPGRLYYVFKICTITYRTNVFPLTNLEKTKNHKMEESIPRYLMGLLIDTLIQAHNAVIQAGCAGTPEQEKLQLRKLGICLVVMGIINAAVAFQAFINLPAKNLLNPIPTCLPVILSIVQGFTFISGFITMTIGWLLSVKDNPRNYRCWAENILLLIMFASVFALGILLLGCSSSARS